MEQTLYEEYAVLNDQIRLLTEQKDELKGKIINEMEDKKETNVDTAVGKFTIAKCKTWTYTEKVKELEEEFKAQKATEQSTGDASFEEKPSLRFTQFKL